MILWLRGRLVLAVVGTVGAEGVKKCRGVVGLAAVEEDGGGGLYLDREEGVNRSLLTDSRKKGTKVKI